jgi:hypothetical protein
MNEINFNNRNTEDIIRILNEIIECRKNYKEEYKINHEKYYHYHELSALKYFSIKDIAYYFRPKYRQLVEDLVDEKYPLQKELPETGIFKKINKAKNNEIRKKNLERSEYSKSFYNIYTHQNYKLTEYSIFEIFDAKKELFKNIPEDMIEMKKKADVLKEEHDKLEYLADKHFYAYRESRYDTSKLYRKYGVPESIKGYEEYMYNLFISGRAKNIQEALDKLEDYAFRQQVKSELTRIEDVYEDSLKQQANMYDDIINKQSKVISEMNSINDKLNTNLREQQYKLDQIQSDVNNINYKMHR